MYVLLSVYIGNGPAYINNNNTIIIMYVCQFTLNPIQLLQEGYSCDKMVIQHNDNFYETNQLVDVCSVWGVVEGVHAC